MPNIFPLFFRTLLSIMCETCAGGCKRASIQPFPEKNKRSTTKVHGIGRKVNYLKDIL